MRALGVLLTLILVTVLRASDSVMTHACDTLKASGNHAPRAFRILGPNGEVLTNRAYAGFSDIVSVHLDWTNGSPNWEGPRLNLHASMIYSMLSAGETVKEALLDANTLYPPRGLSARRLDMKYVGDAHTRIWTVYTGSSAVNNPIPWCKVQ